MKTFGKLILGLTLAVTVAEATGNERGGGSPPPPQIVPEKDVTVQCSITVTQLGEKIHGPYYSHSEQTFTWKKGQVADGIMLELNQINNWRHGELGEGGPFGQTEQEIPALPAGAILEGQLILELLPNGVATEAKIFSPEANGTRLEASAEGFQYIDQSESWNTKANLVVSSLSGSYIKQHILYAGCSINQ